MKITIEVTLTRSEEDLLERCSEKIGAGLSSGMGGEMGGLFESMMGSEDEPDPDEPAPAKPGKMQFG